VRDQLVDVFDFQIRIHHQHVNEIEQIGDRLQTVDRIERQALEQELVVDHRVGIDDADGVAVGRGILAGPGADHLRAAGTVLDHDRLAQPLTQLLAERAHEDVADAAGAGGGQRADRARRPILRRRAKGGQHERDDGGESETH
jgi:hypothetical protein